VVLSAAQKVAARNAAETAQSDQERVARGAGRGAEMRKPLNINSNHERSNSQSAWCTSCCGAGAVGLGRLRRPGFWDGTLGMCASVHVYTYACMYIYVCVCVCMCVCVCVRACIHMHTSPRRCLEACCSLTALLYTTSRALAVYCTPAAPGHALAHVAAGPRLLAHAPRVQTSSSRHRLLLRLLCTLGLLPTS
jgi:hypothetical protein